MSNKVTAAQIEEKIKNVSYTILPDGVTTICQLTLENGYSVQGQSAVVDPASFDATVGRQVAYQNAFSNVWTLEGYLLKEKLYQESINHTPSSPNVMSFSDALELAKRGASIYRKGWPGKGAWVEVQVPDSNSFMTVPYLFFNYPMDSTVLPGARVPWVASQVDIMAEDWKVVV